MTSKTRQGIAPCLGTAEVLELEDFFLILGPAIYLRAQPHPWPVRLPRCGLSYFLNKLSNAARASSALRGAGAEPFAADCDTMPVGAESRATVTRGENNSHEFA